MFKALIIGIWGCIVAAGASYAVIYFQAQKAVTAQSAPTPVDKPERRKATPLTVPVVVDGKIQGYLIVQLALMGPAQALKAQSVPPEVILSSEAFRILFSDERIDFRHLDKYDLKAFSDGVLAKMTDRYGAGVVSEVFVDDFNYVSKDDLKK